MNKTSLKIPSGILEIYDYLKKQESNVPGLIENTEKKIRWYDDKIEKSDYAITYIHGFSATRQEISPVVDIVADKIKANIFYCRLKGHGQGKDDISKASLSDYFTDLNETNIIMNMIGKKKIIIASSTGVPLALWMNQEYKNIDILVMLSPNFKPANSLSSLLLWPFGKYLARLIKGKYEYSSYKNDAHKKYWTKTLKSDSYVLMMRTCALMKKIKLESIKIPILCLYTENDKIVSIPEILKRFDQIGSKHKQIVNLKSPYHVLAGDIVSPDTTDRVIKIIEDFINEYK